MATVAELNKKIEQLKNQKEATLARQRKKDSSNERNIRTKRLIELGALLEKYQGPIEKDEFEKFLKYLQEKKYKIKRKGGN